jgi:hypothetical protein
MIDLNDAVRLLQAKRQELVAEPRSRFPRSYSPVFSPAFAACAACFSLRASFRVCHDLLSVFGFGFSRFCD